MTGSEGALLLLVARAILGEESSAAGMAGVDTSIHAGLRRLREFIAAVEGEGEH